MTLCFKANVVGILSDFFSLSFLISKMQMMLASAVRIEHHNAIEISGLGSTDHHEITISDMKEETLK